MDRLWSQSLKPQDWGLTLDLHVAVYPSFIATITLVINEGDLQHGHTKENIEALNTCLHFYVFEYAKSCISSFSLKILVIS